MGDLTDQAGVMSEAFVFVSDDNGGTVKILGDPDAVAAVQAVISERDRLAERVERATAILERTDSECGWMIDAALEALTGEDNDAE